VTVASPLRWHVSPSGVFCENDLVAVNVSAERAAVQLTCPRCRQTAILERAKFEHALEFASLRRAS
jgi:hypothetical protein